MDVSLIIRLIDQFSAPAKTIAGRLQDIGNKTKQMGDAFGQSIRQGFSVQNIETATKNAEHALEQARGRLIGAFGMAVSLGAPVVQSAKFDQSMRGLDKVLDVTTGRLALLRKFALDTSALIPVAARDLVDLMSEAAQGGVPEAELEAFTLYVGKAAVAFDMAGKDIGDRFAKMRNVYKLNQQGIEQLGDATNHLSNHMAAKANELTDFTNRAAGGANMLKLTAVQATAVGAAMVASGIVPETAARGFNTLATKIVVGGKKADQAFQMLGMSRKKFVQELNQDAPKALQKLFEAMSKSPKGMQALVDLVGLDFSDDFAKLVNNPALLAQAFNYVANAQGYAGSATQEAAKQAEGAVKKWELLQNKLARLSITIGDVLLPTAVKLMDVTGDLIDKTGDFAQAHPALTAAIVQATAAILTFTIAARLMSFAIAAVRLPLIGLASTFLKFDEAGKNIAVGWRMIAGAGSILSAAFTVIRVAAIAAAGALGTVTAPVWAVVAAVIAAGFAVWKYWDRIWSFTTGFASAFSGIWDGIKDAAGASVEWLINQMSQLLNLSPDQIEGFKTALRNAFDFSGLIDGAKEMLSDFWSAVQSFFSQEQLSDGQKAEMYAAGRSLGESLIKGIREFVAEAIAPIQELFKFALEIQWPDPPDWLRWLMDKGGALLDKSGKALSDGGDSVSEWWKGLSNWGGSVSGQGAPPPQAPANDNGWSLSGFWSNLTGASAQAGDDITKGGAAVREGGLAAAREMQNAATAMNAAASNLRSVSVGQLRAGSVSQAISSARTGALHGGTD